MATLADVLTEVRSVVAAVAPSRDATALFLAHETGEPFEAVAANGVEAFHVQAGERRLLESFGREGERHWEATILVQLGHPAFAVEEERERLVATDVERVADALETHAWASPGLEAVFFESADTNRANPLGWLSTCRVRVVFWGRAAP